MNRRHGILLTLGLIALVVGLFGVVDRLRFGLLHVGYGTPIPWALWVALYIYFIGLSAGSFLVSSLAYVFRIRRFEPVGPAAVFTALVCLITALLFIWVDLGHMERFVEVFFRPSWRSPLAWIVWLYTAYFFLLLAEAWFLLRRRFARHRDAGGVRAALYRVLAFGTQAGSAADSEKDLRIVRILGTVGVPLAIAFHGGTGAVFAVLMARPYWNTGLFPILFLVSALASGCALLTAVAAFLVPRGYPQDKSLLPGLGRLLLGLICLEVLMQVAEFLVGLYGSAAAHAIPLQEQLFGANWWLFWIVSVGLAVGIPALILATVGRRNSSLIGLAGLLSAAGFIGIRWNIVLPGFVVPELPGLETAVTEPHLIFGRYVPTPMEWLVSCFAIGVALTLFAIGFGLLPLGEEAQVQI